MKYRIIYILVLPILLYSCSNRSIPQKKLPRIIAEIYLADKYAGDMLRKPSAVSMDSIRIYEAVFNKYGYTSEDYKRTIDKYISRPKKLKIYFESAKSILEEQKNSIQGKLSEYMQLDSLIGVYASIAGNDNYKYAYYRGVQTDKWIYLPYSDSRWPVQKGGTDIFLPVEYDSFWAGSYIPDTTDISDSIDGSDDGIYNWDRDIFVKYNKVGYPIWLFSSQKAQDTLQLGSSINQRVLFPNLLR